MTTMANYLSQAQPAGEQYDREKNYFFMMFICIDVRGEKVCCLSFERFESSSISSFDVNFYLTFAAGRSLPRSY